MGGEIIFHIDEGLCSCTMFILRVLPSSSSIFKFFLCIHNDRSTRFRVN
uniref:Uncharacterized protein n=1 Tax=Rhizophora mucronata TaxID=61149 RepID=A0A2P2NW08_RHIMU